MALRRNCKHQGFAYARDGYKNVRIICELDGEVHNKEYCKKCDMYAPRKRGGRSNGKVY